MNEKHYTFITVCLALFLGIVGTLVYNACRPAASLSIYTSKDIYHLELDNKRIFTETGAYDITFDSYHELAQWIGDKTAQDVQ